MKTVVVSEWARKAAHNLDGRRDAIKAMKRGPNATYDYVDLKIKDNIDHASLLSSSVETCRSVSADATADVLRLQTYLSVLSARVQYVGGEYVGISAWKKHRSLVIKELNYRKELLTQIKQAVRRMNVVIEYQMQNIDRGVLDEHYVLPSNVEFMAQIYALHKRMSKALSQRYTYDEINEIVGDDGQELMRGIRSFVRRHFESATPGNAEPATGSANE